MTIRKRLLILLTVILLINSIVIAKGGAGGSDEPDTTKSDDESSGSAFFMERRDKNWTAMIAEFCIFFFCSLIALLYFLLIMIKVLQILCFLLCCSPDDENISGLDVNFGLFEPEEAPYTMKTLAEYNNELEEDAKLSAAQLWQSYLFLNQRDRFEASDCFAQHVVSKAQVERLEAEASTQPVQEGNDAPSEQQEGGEEPDPKDDDFKKVESVEITARMTADQKRLYASAKNAESSADINRGVAMAAQVAACYQICTTSFFTGDRVLVLAGFSNGVMRICFAVVVGMVIRKEQKQINGNFAVKMSGGLEEGGGHLGFFIRSVVTQVTQFLIFFVIFSSPKEEYEGIVDQVMNFAALLVLIEVDDMLASALEKTVEKFEVDFSYNKETAKEDFVKCASYIKKRNDGKCMQKLNLCLNAIFAIIIEIPFWIAIGVVPMFYVFYPQQVKTE